MPDRKLRVFLYHASLLLFATLLVACGAPARATNTPLLPTATATPVPTETPIPTPMAVEINGNTYTQKSGYDYEAFDTTGKLAYVKDTQGNWIKASYEKPMMIDSSTALTGRLGSDFALNSESNGITGVDGLKIDITKGRATSNIDGKGEETFSTADIHVVSKDVNGQPMKPTLLLAGYAWNPETKKWDIYNPGFPMDVPKDELGWFNQADVANGNWLRWYQRATANVDWNTLFANVMTPFRWEVTNQPGLIWPNWINDAYEANKINPRGKHYSKDIYPGHGGEAYGYLIDKNCVLISFDALNNNGVQTNGEVSVTHMPLIMDDSTWLEHRNDPNFSRIYYAAGKEPNGSVAKEVNIYSGNSPDYWMFWPAMAYPGQTQTGSGGQRDVTIINAENTSLLESEVSPNGFDTDAPLNLWAGFIRINP